MNKGHLKNITICNNDHNTRIKPKHYQWMNKGQLFEKYNN